VIDAASRELATAHCVTSVPTRFGPAAHGSAVAAADGSATESATFGLDAQLSAPALCRNA
jgi:hypothetical protein